MWSSIRHLSAKFLILAVPSVIFTIAAFTGIMVLKQRSALVAELRTRVTEIGRANTVALREPIWLFRRSGIEPILDGMLANPEIVCVANTDLLFNTRIIRPHPGCLDGVSLDRILAFEVVNQGQAIGRLEMAYSTAVIIDRLVEQFWQGLLSLVPLVLALGAVVLAVFRVIIGVPLGHLLAAIRGVGSSSSGVPIPWSSRDELGQVIDAYNRMSGQAEERQRALVVSHGEAEQARAAAVQALEELKETQRTLVQAEKMASLGQLVAGVAHEVNTPVGIVLTAASHVVDKVAEIRVAIQDGRLRRSDLEAFITVVGEGANLIAANSLRAAELIQSFKQVAADRSCDERRRFDLGRYIEGVMVSLGPQIKRRRVTMTVDCPDPIEVDTDPGALAQVLTNFVMNALTHAFDEGQEGTIAFRVALRDGDTIELVCADDGKGISADDLPRIFDPFFTTRRGKGGTGLGLHIVYNLVTSTLGGQIQVHSRSGGGATFTVCFPRRTPVAPEPAVSVPAS